MDILNFDAYIFDLDGTLLDSMSLWDDIYIDALKQLGIDACADYLDQVNHLSIRDGAEFTINNYNITQVTSDGLIEIWNKTALREYENSIQLKKGVFDFLQMLKDNNKKIGAATTSSKNMIFPCLKRTGILDFFSCIISADDIGVGKDQPDIYLKACSELGSCPEKSVVFEDSLTGLITAKSAGFKTVGVWDVTTDCNKDEMKKHADTYIYSLPEAEWK